MAVYRNCVCVELNKLTSPLKCRRALRTHPLVNIFHRLFVRLTLSTVTLRALKNFKDLYDSPQIASKKGTERPDVQVAVEHLVQLVVCGLVDESTSSC